MTTRNRFGAPCALLRNPRKTAAVPTAARKEIASSFAVSGRASSVLALFSLLSLVCMGAPKPGVSPWTTLFETGTASYNCSHPAEAVRQLEAALAGATRQGATELEVASISDSLGAAYEAIGRLADAQSAFDRALATRARLLSAPNEVLAVSLTNESTIFWATANAGKAVEFAEKAKKMWED